MAMTSTIDLISERLASDWTRDVDGGEYLNPLFQQTLQNLFNTVYIHTRRRTQSSDQWICNVFAISDEGKEQATVADDVVRFITNWLPVELTTLGAFLANSVKQEEPQQRTKGQSSTGGGTEESTKEEKDSLNKIISD